MAGIRPALPDATNNAFLQEALNEVNAHRAKHHAPPLTMDPLLVGYARSRAASRSEHEGLSAGHDGLRAGTGESLFWHPGDATAGDAVAAWHDRAAGDGRAEAAGDFGRLVRAGTTRMGAGRVAGNGGRSFETYVVFVFEPPGEPGAV
ncbi:CAP domain-containing protein [Nonomuraea sp. NPDC049655]|uniref:CAP domain-containing protein n=1 Tax=Nonomuraea sp. NPDC049655 TaxID=3364355 RepID=UPI0037B33E87